ncbi:MAG: Na/Pi symporter, partial [Candidatus ainarchaeum sp.]|nr:Na/Pi symporter [Candidatus ainarchaeum sp.]
MLESFQIWFAVIPAIILFLYGIDNFSKEMQKAIGSQFKFLLKWVTKGKFRAALFGAVITALIQTSAATTIIAISLVNSGTITFTQSLGIIFGTNFGSVLTSQLVAFNLMQFASLLIILGFVLSLINSKYKILGKPIFYFGLVMFALNLISLSIIPLKSDPNLILLLSKTSIIPIGILVGFLVTNLFQSGAVTTGLVVIFAQNGMLGLNEALPILFGVNIGKTILSLLVSIRMDSFAKRAAVSHFLYNVIGVLITIPFIGILISIVQTIGGNPAHQVANAHLIFSVSTTIILLIFINQFQKLIEKLIP